MKKKVLSIMLTVAMVASILAGCGSNNENTNTNEAADDSTESANTEQGDAAIDTTAEKNFKILSIWTEDSTEGQILIGLTKQYMEDVNPNFTYEYEYVASSDLSTKISTLIASNDLPDLFVYSAGAPLQELINANKVVNISEALDTVKCNDIITEGAKSSLLSLSNTDDLYDMPFGMNIEGFWYNKAVFEKAGIEVPTTWDELLTACDTLIGKDIQPIATGGADKWPTTRLVNAYAYRSMGADAVKNACAGDTKFTDDGYVAAAQMISDMSQKGYFGEGATTVDNTTAEGMLLNGECAMLYDGSWFTSSITSEETNPSGEDNIGFMGIPVVDESVSKADELPTNCGNILCLSTDKYDAATAGWLQYFVSNVGDYAMSNFQTIKGYKYTADDSQLSAITQTVVDAVNTTTSSTAWWEAYMNDETKSTAQNNIQSLLNGDMDGAAYCESIQEAYNLSN